MTAVLRFMGQGEPETFRCRVYHPNGDAKGVERQRRDFVQLLATEGVIECPAYDNWLNALADRGYAAGELEPAPEHGPGAKVKRWRLTDAGQTWWRSL